MLRVLASQGEAIPKKCSFPPNGFQIGMQGAVFSRAGWSGDRRSKRGDRAGRKGKVISKFLAFISVCNDLVKIQEKLQCLAIKI